MIDAAGDHQLLDNALHAALHLPRTYSVICTCQRDTDQQSMLQQQQQQDGTTYLDDTAVRKDNPPPLLRCLMIVALTSCRNGSATTPASTFLPVGLSSTKVAMLLYLM